MDLENADVKKRIYNIKTRLYNLLYEIKHNKCSSITTPSDEQIDNDVHHAIEKLIDQVTTGE